MNIIVVVGVRYYIACDVSYCINSSGRVVYAVSTIRVSLYSDPMCRVVDKDQPICMQAILQKLLQKAIAQIRKVNKVKGIDFTKKMQALVEQYNDRTEQDILKSEVYEEMAETLTNMIMEVRAAFKDGEDKGLSFEENAFYDILKSLCEKYHFTYPEDKLISLSKKVKELVDEQSTYPDWDKREDIKSALKVDLIILLDEFGYPPVERDEVYGEIFEQAENFKKNR